jgi:[acyl-carrier-protein] S-malonyltransferase
MAKETTGVDAEWLLLEAPGDVLARTEYAQLAVVLTGLMALEELRAAGMAFDVAMGHSVGEFAALVAAGVISPEEALHLVWRRGLAMADACAAQAGAMTALRGPAPMVVDATEIARAFGTVFLAADNSPIEVVVAGADADLDSFVTGGAPLGMRCVRLPVQGAFHSPLMASAAGALAAAIAEVTMLPASAPVVANLDAREHHEPSGWADRLVDQLTAPVLWRPGVQRLCELGIEECIEVGATGVLRRFVRQTAPGLATRLFAARRERGALDAPRR